MCAARCALPIRVAQEAAADHDVGRYGSTAHARPSDSITIAVSTAPAPKPPSSSANGTAEQALFGELASRRISSSSPLGCFVASCAARIVVGIGLEQAVDAVFQQALLVG
jgi:hypothetical protein